MEANPYTPGAGVMPLVLAGRENTLDLANSYLDNLCAGLPQQPIIYYGLRGVGKTVVLNTIEYAAENRNILYRHIEAGEDKMFTKRLIAALTYFTKSINPSKIIAEDAIKKCLSLLRAFKMTYSPIDGSIEVGLENSFDTLESTGVYSEDLREIFVMLGTMAQKAETAVCIFVDEMQYLSQDEILGLVSSLHRCMQLRLPITMFCAGLPKVRKAVGEACSYSERLFRFEEISALTKDAAVDAICGPAERFGVKYTADAVQEIIQQTECYPYFLQEFCSIIWKNAKEKTVTKEVVLHYENDFFQTLDNGFFTVRYDRCSNQEKAFMTAMVCCDDLPCTISSVAAIMGKKVRSISPTRGKLINKGLIYATGHAEIDFTVPQFDNFIRRINPNLELTQ